MAPPARHVALQLQVLDQHQQLRGGGLGTELKRADRELWLSRRTRAVNGIGRLLAVGSAAIGEGR
jgi:hypothetical protein